MIRALRLALLGGTLGLAACGAKPTPPVAGGPADPLASVSLPALPDWTDKYAAKNSGDMRFFRISALMERYGLTRLQAVELQNHYRDLSRADEGAAPQALFDKALAKIQRGEIESRVNADDLAKAKFIVVFDLDETLYSQYDRALGPDCNDVAVPQGEGKKPHYVKLNPGWKGVFERIRSLGGAIVLFSANRDEPTWANLRAWQWEGKPVATHPNIAGVLTNSYLTRTGKAEPPGTAERPKHPVVAPSKDLRQFDESLSKVIIVDDNPTRLFQWRNIRLYKKFHAKDLCKATDKSGPVKAMAERQMAKISAEIMDAVAYVESHPKATFAQAYLPYTMIGTTAVQGLMEGNDWSREQAVTYLRENPEAVDKRY